MHKEWKWARLGLLTVLFLAAFSALAYFQISLFPRHDGRLVQSTTASRAQPAESAKYPLDAENAGLPFGFWTEEIPSGMAKAEQVAQGEKSPKR